MGHNEEYIEINLREMLFYVLRRWKSAKEALKAAVGAPLVSDQLVIPEKK